MSPMGLSRGLLAVLALIVSFQSVMLSQGVTTAAINGVVTDKNGAPLPGANVVAVHVPSGTTYGTSTRENGRYFLPGMRVGGPYSVTVSVVGYKKEVQDNIWLQLSQTADLNFSLSEEAVQGEEVVIIGEKSPVFNASHNGATTNVSRQQIDRLPTITRNFQDFYKLSPYVSSADKGNVLGRNSKYNNIQIDGTNFNDLFGLGSTGAPAGQVNTTPVTPISLDAIQEFQIVVSPYDVRQSGFTGAGINAITRSGTNTYTGSIFYYGRNEGLAGKTPTDDTAKRLKLAGFSDYQLGGRVGGPILENELFFFANAEMTRFKQPFTRTFGQTANTTNGYIVSLDSLNILTNYLKSKYGYDPGSWSTINQVRESDKLFLRFDYNISEQHKLQARWNFLRSQDDNSPSRGRGATDIYADNGRYKLDNKTHSVAVQLSSVFGNQASNEFILGYVDQFDNPVYYGSPFPTLYIGATNKTEKLVLGAEEFRHYNELGQKYFEITDNFSYYLPQHTLTVGAKADLFKFRNLFIPDAFGQYAYSSIARFMQDLPPDGTTGASAYTFRYSATSDPLQEANWGANQFGVYAQDEWTVNPALKLIAGVRVDIPTYSDHPNYNRGIDSTFGYRTDTPPKTSVAFSPRIGFNWSVDPERTTQVRGGVGVFYGRFPFVWVGNQYANTGVDFYTVTTAPASFNPNPYGQAKLPPTSTTAEVDLTDPNFKAPSIFRYNLAVDYKLPYDLVATVEGIFSTTLNDVYYQNINLKGLQTNPDSTNGPLTPGGRLRGENRQVWGIVNAAGSGYASTPWVNNAFSPGVFLVKNTDQGSNANVTIQVQRNALNGLNGTVAYTWGVSKDINSGNSTTASSGWRFNPTQGDPNTPALTYSQWDRRHRLLAALSYKFDWGINGLATTVGVFYSGQSGRPFSYMVNGDVNGDGRSDNDLVYIPKDAGDILLTNSAGTVLPTSDVAYTTLMNFINADDYLKDHKGMISERSGPHEPWSHQVDIRIQQDIPTIAGQKIELTFDILNVLNLINGSWGWQRNTGVNQTYNMLNFKGIEKTPGANYGRPKYQVPTLNDPFQPDNIASRWQAQFGIRYTL